MNRIGRVFIKGISFVLVLVFLADELSFAAGSFHAPARDNMIPKDLGVVRQSVKGSSDKLIINIQDAHAKLGAQKSISEIIGKLAGRFDLRFVALEGSAGPVDTSLVSSFPDAASRKGAAEDLLKTGKISAAEFYSMVTGGKLPLYGVDNPKLHSRHVDALKALLERRGAIRQEISPVLALLSRLEKDILSERARFFLKNRLADTSDEDLFGEDWRTLASLGALNGLDADAYEELSKFDRVLRLEKEIDFREASRERNRLVEELGKLLEGKSLENFILQALRFKNDPSAATAFHSFISEQAAALPGGPARYPNLTLYAAYLSIHDSMDLVKLLFELDVYKRSVREKVLSEDEKRFFEIREEFLSMNRLFLTSLTVTEYEGLTKRPFRDPAEWAGELDRFREKYRPREPAVSGRFEAMNEALPIALRYYELAEARNRDLLKNTLRKMEEDGARVAVLVTGGFHSEGMADLMRSKGLSYTVVMPKFDVSSPDRPYLALFTGKPEEFVGDPDTLDDDLALRPYFDASWDSASTLLERKKSLALTLAHFYKAYGRFDENLRRQYVRSFARQHRELAQKGASLSDLSPAVVAKMLKNTSLKEVDGGYEVRFPEEAPLVVSLSDGQVSVAGARLSRRPEIVSGAVFMIAAAFGILPAASVGLFLAGAVILRAATALGILTHGLGHGIFTAVLDRSLKPLSFSSIAEGVSSSRLWRSLVPFGPALYDTQGPDATAPRVPSGDGTLWKIRLKSLGGIFFNTAIAAAIFYFIPGFSALGFGGTLDFIAGFTAISLILTNGFFAAFSWSDIAAFVTGRAAFFYCGNFGIIAESRPEDNGELLPERFVRMALKMGRETEIRGEQAGGGLIFAENKKGKTLIVGKKIVNRKRHNLTEALERSFLKARSRAAWKGLKRLPGLVKAAWHYRYGTSSKPAVIETHWHEWMQHRKARVWTLEKGKLVAAEKLVNHRITHNGDFDDWNIFGKDQSNADIGKWLERVLWTKNTTKGDSPKVAGMMDILITQGMWDASLRLAYQLAVAESMKDPVPTREEIRLMSQTAEKVFNQRLGTLFAPNALNLMQVKPEEKNALSADLARALAREPKAALWSEAKRTTFAKEAVHAFFYNSSFEATRVFISRAKGSFGLVVVSTLDRERMVLVSRGQPITLGFNIKEGYGIYASEPAAVNAVLKSDTSGEETFRLDLNQSAGEIAWMGAKTVGIYSLSEKRALKDEEINERFIEMKDNPYITPEYPATSADPVESDIREIPRVLAAIRKDWKTPGSFNRQTADRFVELLKSKIKSPRKSGRAPDLLIVGIENNVWLGEQFANDLKKIIPGLVTQVISANKLLEYPTNYPISGETVVLNISQSGQTFPSLQTASLFEGLRKKGKIADQFILTGELDSLMGVTIGQNYSRTAPFTKRIFTSGAGRRTTEPSTLAVTAMNQTLTELLFYSVRKLKTELPEDVRDRVLLSLKDLEAVEIARDGLVDRSASAITGRDARGNAVHSPEYEKLTARGKIWGRHVTEPAISWFAGFVYVVAICSTVAILTGLPPVAAAVNFIFMQTTVAAAISVPVVKGMIVLDMVIGYYSSYLFTLTLRYFQGRTILARRGKRTLVIGDVPYVHQLLESYVSKLFSLSYGDAALDVHGANPRDHMLHRFGHRIVRGTLVYLGVPDGRRDERIRRAENAVVMTGKQALGVANRGVSAEVVTIGHNPALKSKGFDDAVILPSESEAPPGSELNAPSLVEDLKESRVDSFERLLGGYVLFWSMAKKVSSLPFFGYQHWKSQSRTKIATTASPVSGLSVEEEPLSEPVQEPTATVTPTISSNGSVQNNGSGSKPSRKVGYDFPKALGMAHDAYQKEISLLHAQTGERSPAPSVSAVTDSAALQRLLLDAEVAGGPAAVADVSRVRWEYQRLLNEEIEKIFQKAGLSHEKFIAEMLPLRIMAGALWRHWRPDLFEKMVTRIKLRAEELQKPPAQTPAPKQALDAKLGSLSEEIALLDSRITLLRARENETASKAGQEPALLEEIRFQIELLGRIKILNGRLLELTKTQEEVSAQVVSMLPIPPKGTPAYEKFVGAARQNDLLSLEVKRVALILKRWKKIEKVSFEITDLLSESKISKPSKEEADRLGEALASLGREKKFFYRELRESIGQELRQADLGLKDVLKRARSLPLLPRRDSDDHLKREKLSLEAESLEQRKEELSLQAEWIRQDLREPSEKVPQTKAAGVEGARLADAHEARRTRLHGFYESHDPAGFQILKPFIERIDGKRSGVLTESEKMRLLLAIESALPEPVKKQLVSGTRGSKFSEVSILAGEAGFMERVDREWARIIDADDSERQAALNRLPRLADAVSRALSGNGISGTYGTFAIESDRLALEASGHLRARFALTDPSYHVTLPDLSATTTRARKTIVTDLEVFLKDAGGKPYAYRMERLNRRTRGLFRHILLVRDPLITSREELRIKYPETAVFGDRVLFAPGLRDADDVRNVARDLEIDPDAVVVAPDPEALKAGHSVFLSNEKIYVLSLGRGSETSIGALETAALVVSDPDRLPSRVKRTADGMYIYLPPPAPWDYLELLRYAMNAQALSQSA